MANDRIEIWAHNGIGDQLFITPTLRRIKEAHPEKKVVVNARHGELFRNNPFVDSVGVSNRGVKCIYTDPKRGLVRKPDRHHIVTDWEIIKGHYGLDLKPPELKPELYLFTSKPQRFEPPVIGVQVEHKRQWHNKRVWPFFEELFRPPFLAIPKFSNLVSLVGFIARCSVVVCAEGGISHIARAVGTPAVVVYGGFADPAWNGYEDNKNITNFLDCSPCYNELPCVKEPERKCLRQIDVKTVERAAFEFLF